MLYLIMSLLVSMTASQGSCIKTNGDIEFWVNTATNAAQATKIIATESIVMPELTVNGHVTLGSSASSPASSGEEDTIQIIGVLQVTGTASFTELQFQKQDDTWALLKDVIKVLEQKIDKLCQASKAGDNVCEL